MLSRAIVALAVARVAAEIPGQCLDTEAPSAYDGYDTHYSCYELVADKLYLHYKTVDDDVHFIVHAKDHVNKAFGVAISESGTMDGADFALYVPAYDQNKVMDYWSGGFATPFLDEHQHITTLAVVEADGDTIVHFVRPAATGDVYDVAINTSPGALNTVLYYIATTASFEIYLKVQVRLIRKRFN